MFPECTQYGRLPGDNRFNRPIGSAGISTEDIWAINTWIGRWPEAHHLFEQVCTVGVEIGAVARETMFPLFGTIKCTMLVAQNVYGGMGSTVELLKVVVCTLPSVLPDGFCNEAQVWSILVHVSCEVIRLCSSIATEGNQFPLSLVNLA